jgi:hypothetical protein
VIAIAVDNESDTIFIAKQMSGGRIPTSISMWRFDGANSQDKIQLKKNIERNKNMLRCVFSDSRWRDVPGALLTGKDVALFVYQRRLYVSGIVIFQNNNSTTRCTKYEHHKPL